METYNKIAKHFAELSAALIATDRTELRKAVEILQRAKEKRSNVWIFGNGGSSATASHFANDLTKMASIKAIALADQTPTMMAYGNDDGWENMFSHMLDVFQGRGDVLVAISCSGNSQNVIEAVKGMDRVIVMTGNEFEKNKLVHMGGSGRHAILAATHSDITVQEDIHVAICHAIAKALRY